MPNATKGGYRFKRSLSGATGPTITLEPVATLNTLAIFTGDVVSRTAGGYAYVTAAAGVDILGVMDGVEQYWDGENLRKGRVLPANTAYGTVLARKSIIRVISALDAVFEVDCNDGVTYTTEAAYITSIGENCAIVATAGDTTTGQSGHCLNIASHVATAAAMRILGIAPVVDGPDFAASRVKLEVKVNQSHLAGVGV